jgi:hypothetical protein
VAPKTATRRPARKPTRRAKPVAKPKAQVEVEDLEAFNESINIMVYGDSGVGKTPFVGKAPKAVFLSTEKGSISAKRFGSQARLIRAQNWEKIEAAIEYLEEHLDEFDWVIVDSLTKMQQLLIRGILQDNVNEQRAKADLDIPQIQDHQKWQNKFKRFVDRLIDLEINVIFVCTAMHREDEEGEPLVLPHIQGKDYEIAQYVMAQMDTILCLRVADEPDEDGNPIWVVRSRTFPPYFAKDRYDALPPRMEDPNMAEIIELIENSAAEDDVNPNVAKRRKRRAKAPDVEDLSDEGYDDMEEDVADDEEPPEDDADEDEETPEPPKRRRATAATRKAKPAGARRRPAKAEPEDDPDDEEDRDYTEDDDEEEAPPARRRTARRSTRKPTPARRKAKPEPEEDEFDPDDGDEDFDDDED